MYISFTDNLQRSDRDSVFLSTLWRELFQLQGVDLALSFVYHPHTDGHTEAINRSFESYLQCMVQKHP